MDIGKCEISPNKIRSLGQQVTAAQLAVDESRNSASDTHCATGIIFIGKYMSHVVRAFCSQHSLRSLEGQSGKWDFTGRDAVKSV